MTMRQLRIALYQPDIAGNTGTIIRMAACLGLAVDIIEPAGFDTSDRNLKRAGMDYLELASVTRYAEFAAFDEWRRAEGRRLVLLSTKAEASYFEFEYRPDDILLFGRESAGVPDYVHDLADARVTIKQVAGRSLNLAVSAAMAAGEAVRQIDVSSVLPKPTLEPELYLRLKSATLSGALSEANICLREYKDRGYASDQVLALLQAWLDEAMLDDDKIRDVMDIVTGFCPPEQRIW